MSEFKRPSASDTMIDHAEQHGFIYDEVNKLKSVVEDLQDAVAEIKNTLKDNK